MSAYSIGLDFGTEEARALLVDLSAGSEVAVEHYRYRHGVITSTLPVDEPSEPLGTSWALQDPEDYLRAIGTAVPSLLRRSDVGPEEVVGVGVSFTSCTMLPVTAEGRPLCTLLQYRRNPHAWVKLWKHHTPQPQARRIEDLARTRKEGWLPRYGDSVSSEWLFPKILETLEMSPDIYEAADYFIEAADWITWKLTGLCQMSACTAGYKAFWSSDRGFPSRSFFAEIHPKLEAVVSTKLPPRVTPVGATAGLLCEEASRLNGLRAGTPVATPIIDAHSSALGATVTRPGRMVLIMGTSLCQILLAESLRPVRGIAGAVEGGVVPGLVGYEAGQPSLGDTFAWAANTLSVEGAESEADRFLALEDGAAQLRPGGTGLLALDWLNGNRSILDDSELSGMLIGLTLSTSAYEVYRALMEACAFGARVVIEEFEAQGVPAEDLVACGGLAHSTRLLPQIIADVCGRTIRVAESSETSALGAAIYGGVAAGPSRSGFRSVDEAVARVARLEDRQFVPNAGAERIYDHLYAEYRTLHDYLGKQNSVMKVLRQLREGSTEP
ncbi:MAG: ribulokinase [Rhodothermia bacterium]|nr:ribulokinase [Rhodothermia bacterium]